VAWEAPPECPQREQVLARVAELLADEPASPLAIRANVSVEAGGAYRAEIVTREPEGAARTRVLSAPSCGELAEASAVVIALAIAPGAALAPPADDAQPAPAPAPPARPEPPAVPELGNEGSTEAAPRAPAARRPLSLRFAARAGALGDFGSTSGAGLGVSAGGTLRLGRYLQVALRANYLPSRQHTVPGVNGKGVALSLASGAAFACLVPLAAPVELGLCGEMEVGALFARGFGTAQQGHPTVAWTAPGAGATASFPARSGLRAGLAVDVLFPLQRTSFIVTNVGQAYHLRPAAERVGIFAEYAFP
jgi:hypothetical protein